MTRNELEFDVLGYKVRMKDDGSDRRTSPSKAVELVLERARSILDRYPSLDRGKVAVLVALELAADKLDLENEYREDIEKLHQTTTEAIQFIEDLAPPTLS
ncbi:MAG: hypothetical protein COW00_18095 [Bdellovibrio sp. CG12_big_fil_rev_8_21_14_0_65_39_13]|nr:MAG: hypothetical protein COW78_06075 [Bdellovibrio sp. CG22_combo_CG10-13_8_21_14_all_39_27]PIQ58021.1 MAG: hypothetical protein COW00_18095 [Bdellovibrio sp. CG12_big_fil_rev_8_21_14_0_65_39_13]PIR36931.1 MAG: hypothetical protein COV37_00125 [Bdellovibrio sp. CG11_big_fil_rev_8_21_14_0_20_39_38]PJB53299.1 MAG: hypothetical protein CO099_07875 [Bdellovibrio sp. CG_4_9_14_3_um_filter_39_7]